MELEVETPQEELEAQMSSGHKCRSCHLSPDTKTDTDTKTKTKVKTNTNGGFGLRCRYYFVIKSPTKNSCLLIFKITGGQCNAGDCMKLCNTKG